SVQRDSQPPIKKEQTLASAAPSTKDKLVPPANRIDPPAGTQASEPLSPDEPREIPPAIEAEEVQVAMDGYCPVTLRTTRSWKTGDKTISHEYEGQLYYFVSAERRNEFKAHP